MVDTKPTSEVAPFASMQKLIPELDNMYFSNDYLHVLVASHKGTTIFDIHFKIAHIESATTSTEEKTKSW